MTKRNWEYVESNASFVPGYTCRYIDAAQRKAREVSISASNTREEMAMLVEQLEELREMNADLKTAVGYWRTYCETAYERLDQMTETIQTLRDQQGKEANGVHQAVEQTVMAPLQDMDWGVEL